jgi:hypothetical protein
MTDDVVYVVSERSAVGDTILGVFSTIDDARRALPPRSIGRLEDYRVHAHVLGASPDPRTPWSVVLSRDGTVESCEITAT